MSKTLNLGIFLISLAVIGACASKTPLTSNAPQEESLSAHQLCLQKEQNEKKMVYDSLPNLLKRVSGDSQIISEYGSFKGSLPLLPKKSDLDSAISKVTETPEKSGSWGTAKEAHSNTVSGYVIRRSELSHPPSKASVPLFHFSVGQPGRPYRMPLSAFRSDGNGLVGEINETYRVTPTTGLPSDRVAYLKKVKARMKLQSIDDKHVLVLVDDRSPKGQGLNFTSKHAFLIRTYPHRDFDTDDLWQEWPVFDEGEPQSSCDAIE